MAQQKMLINAVHPEEFRVALVEGQNLEGFFIETSIRGKTVGNIYKGIIVHVHPSLQAAFVDYGAERNGFLPLPEIHPEYHFKEAKGTVRIQDVVKTGQEVLVQVVKEEMGTKGAALTTYPSLAGRYLVLMPGRTQYGVSRKIEDEEQREHLKELARDLEIPEEFGVIIRTVSQNCTKREIKRDFNYLMRIWGEIKKRAQESPAPAVIYKERDLATRVVRDYFNAGIKAILVDDKEIYRRLKDFLRIISPRQKHVVKLHKDNTPILSKYHIEQQIEQIYQKRVPLKSGGSLVIESTEALVTVDVNSGRANREEELEETVYRVNLEAAEEIPRQLRLRDMGGLVVIDFIDMRDRRHTREVERRLREGAKKDKAKMTIGRISRFGLLELSRQRLGLMSQMGSYTTCPNCQGTGLVRSPQASALSYLRKIWLTLAQKKAVTVKATLALDVAAYLQNQKRADLRQLEETYQTTITIDGSPSMLPHEGRLEFVPKEPAS